VHDLVFHDQEVVALAAFGANQESTAVDSAIHSSLAEPPWSASVEALFALALSQSFLARPGQELRRKSELGIRR
jgi:hypothetical protein